MNDKDKTNVYIGFERVKNIKNFCDTYSVSRSILYKKIMKLDKGIHTIKVHNLQLTVIKD